MAYIRPFRGLLYDTEKIADLSEVTAPPYDVIGPRMQEELYARSPYNVVRLELNRAPGEERYAEAARTLEKWRGEGILARDKRPAFYRYVQDYEVPGTGGLRKRRIGFFALVRLEPFEAGVVLPHERTLPKAKADRLELMKRTSTNISQVFTFYGDPGGKVDGALRAAAPSRPDVSFTDDVGVVHELARIDDEATLSKVSGLLAEKQLFIADGHHRYETALNYRDWRRERDDGYPDRDRGFDFLEIYLTNMDHDGLSVLPIHRVVHSLEGFSAESFLGKMAETFEISEAPGGDRAALLEALGKSDGRTAFGVALAGRPFMTARLKEGLDVARRLEGRVAPVAQDLDVARLHSLVLEDVLAIDQEAILRQTNVRFDADRDRALDSLEKDAQVVFVMNPTRIEQVRAVAGEGEKMPQKSTFFYPKLLTGLVMNPLDP